MEKKQLYDPCPICNMRKIKEHHRIIAVINWVKESKKIHGNGEYNYYLLNIKTILLQYIYMIID